MPDRNGHADELLRNFSENLSRLLEENNMTAKELAKRAGVRESTVSRIRSRTDGCTLVTAVRLAEVFNKNVDDLIQPPEKSTASPSQLPIPIPKGKFDRKKFKTVRKNRGFSQEKVGLWLGLNQSQVSRIEQGRRRVGPNTVKRLAIFFGCSIGELTS